MAIYQADQYNIPFEIEQSGEIVTPETIDDVRIVIGKMERSYSDSSLSFADGKWLFPIKCTETACLRGHIKGQVEIRRGDNIVHSDSFCVCFKDSLPAFREGVTT